MLGLQYPGLKTNSPRVILPPTRGSEGLMFSLGAGKIWIWISAELLESHSFCYYSNRLRILQALSPASCLRCKCLCAGDFIVWGTTVFFFFFPLWCFNEAASLQRQRGQHKAGAKNHGKAERERVLVLTGGTFSIFCLPKRCEVGKDLRFSGSQVSLPSSWALSSERDPLAAIGNLSPTIFA